MPTDKVNKFQTGLANYSPIRSFDERKNAASGRKQGNVLPLEHPKHNYNGTEPADNWNGRGDAPSADGEGGEGSTAEIKSRVESVLSRIKSEVTSSDPAAGEVSNYGSGETLNVGDARGSSNETPGGNASYNIKSVTAELERRRAELFALARGAEDRAREAEERFKQAEIRLDQEIAQRRVVEQRLRELEDEYLQRLSAAEAEEMKRLEAELAREDAENRLREADNRARDAEARIQEEAEARTREAEARLREVEKRLKEAEARFKEADDRVFDAEDRLKEETKARMLAEKAMADAEAKAGAATIALAGAEQRRAEADTRARAAEDNAREIEALIGEAESIAHTANERYKAAEAKLQHEVELRALAEQKLKSLEDELSSYLGLDWSKSEPQISQVVAAPATTWTEEMSGGQGGQLQAQLEAEQKARAAAEKVSAAAEVKLSELEAELRKMEEKHRQAEAGFKKMLRKQEAELRTFSEQVTRSNASTTELSLVKSGEGEYTQNVGGQPMLSTKIKLVSYGAVITLLLIMLSWLVVEVARQM